jgi:hypothetical protein
MSYKSFVVTLINVVWAVLANSRGLSIKVTKILAKLKEERRDT